jgi:ABC-type branched-subunit amino acid transport system ATPase component
LIVIDRVSRRFGGIVAVDECSFRVEERTSLIGNRSDISNASSI